MIPPMGIRIREAMAFFGLGHVHKQVNIA